LIRTPELAYTTPTSAVTVKPANVTDVRKPGGHHGFIPSMEHLTASLRKTIFDVIQKADPASCLRAFHVLYDTCEVRRHEPSIRTASIDRDFESLVAKSKVGEYKRVDAHETGGVWRIVCGESGAEEWDLECCDDAE